MNDGAKTQEIERRIDRGVADGLEVVSTGGSTNLVPRNMGEVMEFAKMMAVSGACVRPQFRNNPGACLGITMFAMRVGFDPFAVANKAYVTASRGGAEQIAYEAQLLHAIVESRAPLSRRLRGSYSGEGTSRRCKVTGYLKGEEEPFEYESPMIKDIAVQNSPLWKADPDQQLWYYSTRAWARRWVPDVLMGVYTPDEIEDIGQHYGADNAKDVTPPARPTRDDFRAGPPTPKDEVIPEPKWHIVDVEGQVGEHHDAEVAAASLIEAMSDAAARGEQPLHGVWESNATFLTALREAKLDELADSLKRTYGATLDELSRQRAAAEEEKERARVAEVERIAAEKKAAEAATKPKPEEPKPAPAEAKGKETAAAGSDATPQASAQERSSPPAAAAAPSGRKPTLPKSPLATRRATDWPAWVEAFTRLIRYGTKDEAMDLWQLHSAEVNFCETNRKKDHEAIEAAMDDMRG